MFPKLTVAISCCLSAETRRECVQPCTRRTVPVSHSWPPYSSQKNLLWIADLEKDMIGPNLVWDKVINDFEANYE